MAIRNFPTWRLGFGPTGSNAIRSADLVNPTVEPHKAQPPLRNRASAMHLFIPKLLSITVMTYTYVCTCGTYVR